MNILTVDGGFSAPVLLRLVKRIEEQNPGFLAATDLFSGVSDGASVALYMSKKLSEGCSSTATIDGAIEFSNALTATMQASPLALLRSVCGWGSYMLVQPFQDVLREWLGDTTLGQLKKPVAIISFDLDTSTRKVFGVGGSHPAQDQSLPLYEINWASGALPLCCPVYATQNGHYYADGGLVDNNPAMAALVTALSNDARQAPGEPKKLDGIALLSLGTESDEPIAHFTDPDSCIDALLNTLLRSYSPLLDRPGTGKPVRSRTWGWKQWLLQGPLSLARLSNVARQSSIDAECKQLLGRNYLRYAPSMDTIATAMEMLFWPTKLVLHSFNEQASKLAGEPAFQATLAWVAERWSMREAEPPAGA